MANVLLRSPTASRWGGNEQSLGVKLPLSRSVESRAHLVDLGQ